MQKAKNGVHAGPYNFIVKGSNRPFGNNFVLQRATVVQYEGQDEVEAVVLCTNDSKEPGRLYLCYFSTKGKLEGCNTLN